MTRTLAVAALVLIGLAAILAPLLSPHDAADVFRASIDAPPTPVHFIDAEGRWRSPFFYPSRVVSRLERRFDEDRTSPVPLVWLANRRLVSEPAGSPGPFLVLGADGAGHDVFARLLYGARVSLGVALIAIAGAVGIGLIVGGLAGARGGWLDATLMRLADVIAVLPALYIVVVLRASLPLVLPTLTIALVMTAIFAVVGAPWIARGVRAIVAAERSTAYAEAARALGASQWRVLVRHLLPATRGFVVRQATLLLPAFVLAEATLSFVGLGFADTVPSWGTALQEAADVTAIAAFPWILAPAAALFLITLFVNIALGADAMTESVKAPN